MSSYCLTLMAIAYLATSVAAQRCRQDNLASTNNAVACTNSLRDRGGNCRVTSPSTTFCQVGDAVLLVTTGPGTREANLPW